ncbi:glutathione S-transferase family protein [Oceanicaulis sp. LC35]|uniref:glutathione S-transferase family protein n=1 Tax=Oceanicaulis sp. LC35 TaxID=3349635 RepID=UPI003F832362
MGLTYTLIGTPFSAASIKARLCLRWANLPMTEKPATVDVVQTYIKPRLKTVATPLIVSSDQTAFTDTRLLFDALHGSHPARTLYPDTPAQRFASDLLEAWSDSRFSRQAEYVFWVCERERAEARLARFLEADSPADLAARRARLVAGQIGKQFARMGLDQQAETAVLARLNAMLARLDKALGASPFLFGERPAMAEFSLAGALHVLAGTQAGSDMLDLFPRLGAWRMRLTAVDGLAQGDHRKASSSPSAFMQLMRDVAQDFAPRALESASAVADWAEAHPGARALPDRISLGRGRKRASRVKGQAAPVWSPRDAYWLSRLGAQARPHYGVENAELYRLLKTIGLLPLRDYTSPREIVALNHRLELSLRDVQSDASHDSLHKVESALMAAREATADIAELTAIHV